MSTQGEDFATIYGRELDRLAGEIRAYSSEAEIWTVSGDQKNSPGTLVLHLCGNLMHFIGAGFGVTAYIRDREAEFADRCTRNELLAEIAETREIVTRALATLSDEVMDGRYPGRPPSSMGGVGTRLFLMHLLWHIGWHEGHIYYHRLGGGAESL